MIADITIPPFTTLLLILGAILVVLSLSGQITIKEAVVGIPQRGLRILAGLIGIGLIGAAVWMYARPASSPQTTTLNSPPGTPAAGPPVTGVNNPAIPYDQLAGTWKVIEKVRQEHGGEEIFWTYDAKVLGTSMTMEGKKTRVNDAGSTKERELTADDKGTVSVFSLALNGAAAIGTFEERDSHGDIIHGNLRIQFARDLRSFSGASLEGDAEASGLIGTKR
ncbi:MAG: hypothetical protein QOD54_1989 [Sphingomonadales bacterium]|nr:hypothetical protein [Sphingomonadales bacterium]